MTEFYKAEYASKAEKSNIVFIIAAAVAAACGISLCVFFVVTVDTANAASREWQVIATTIITGWTVMTLIGAIYENKHFVRHIDSILTAELSTIKGTLSIERKRVRIGGVIAYVGSVKTADNKDTRVLIYERMIGKVRALKKENVFKTAYGFIVAEGEDLCD